MYTYKVIKIIIQGYLPQGHLFMICIMLLYGKFSRIHLCYYFLQIATRREGQCRDEGTGDREPSGKSEARHYGRQMAIIRSAITSYQWQVYSYQTKQYRKYQQIQYGECQRQTKCDAAVV